MLKLLKINISNTFLILLTILFSQQFFATTIQKLSFAEIVDWSELIVEGEVTSVTYHESGSLIYTRILMKVNDVLKGEDPGEFIELDFLGGEQSGKTVSVSGQDVPVDGERGFYFIEDLSMQTVNPLTGWYQGHFRILSDLKGNEYLETETEQELLEISDSKNSALAAKLLNMKFGSTLVEKAFFIPVTPDELRQAVAGLIDGE